VIPDIAAMYALRPFVLRQTMFCLTDRRGGPEKPMTVNPVNRGLAQGGHIVRSRLLRERPGQKVPNAGKLQDPAITWHKIAILSLKLIVTS